MTDDRMTLIEMIEKEADGDCVREMLALAAERLMELEVETATGAPKDTRSPIRSVQRNGYRSRGWGEGMTATGPKECPNRAGRIGLAIPKLRRGSYFPSVLEPRRTATRNALAHAPAKSRTAVAAMLKTIFAEESKAAAEARREGVAGALREKNARLGTMMDASSDDVLAYMDFLGEHRAQVSSTNPLERVNKEIRRRSDVVEIFRNDDAIIRPVGALMLEYNDEWAVAHRHMTLETLTRIDDDASARLPAVAA